MSIYNLDLYLSFKAWYQPVSTRILYACLTYSSGSLLYLAMPCFLEYFLLVEIQSWCEMAHLSDFQHKLETCSCSSARPSLTLLHAM